jgi:hypothetical protein
MSVCVTVMPMTIRLTSSRFNSTLTTSSARIENDFLVEVFDPAPSNLNSICFVVIWFSFHRSTTGLPLQLPSSLRTEAGTSLDGAKEAAHAQACRAGGAIAMRSGNGDRKVLSRFKDSEPVRSPRWLRVGRGR